MKHSRVQSAALFLAGITAAASQQVEPISGDGVNNTLCSSIPFVELFDESGFIKYWAQPVRSIEGCLESLQVDKDNMIDHIRALNKVFSQSYAFYNIAKAPAASEPKDHQAELGYTLFTSPDEGVVDIDAEFTSIIQKVEDEGATLASFWEIQSVANRLRDGHLAMPSINAEDLEGIVFFLPERIADTDGAVKGKQSFSNDPLTGDLQLKIDWEDENGTKSESVVESMDGMTPYEFFLKVSNSPSVNSIAYQSRGARLNALLMESRKQSDILYRRLGDHNQAILPLYAKARPSDVYPSEILVKYADGGEETYHAYFFDPVQFLDDQGPRNTDSTLDFDVTALEGHINKQGISYAQMSQVIEDTLSVVNVDSTVPQPTGKEVRSVGSGAESERFFDDFWNASGDDHGEDDAIYALKLMDGYAVLKVESFASYENPESLSQAWKVLAEKCKDLGIKKLIVDISNNGGGIGVLGTALATLMYPTATHEWYQKNNAIVINEPMRIYRDKIEGVFDQINGDLNGNATDEVLRDVIDGLTESRLKQVNDAFDIFQSFCDGIQCVDPNNCSKHCALLDDFQKEWAAFSACKSPPLLKALIGEMIELMQTFNRFSKWGKFDHFDKAVTNTVNQGGTETKLTGFFTDYFYNYYDLAAKTSLESNADFDEYIVLSNGAAVSTAHTFSSKVMQLWNNRDKTQVTSKLTTVSYGGLKEGNGDVTMAGITAIVEDVHLENELIAAGVTYVFNEFILDGSVFFDEASSALDEYFDSLPTAPYFANTLPRMPVVGDYDTAFMGEDTVPLQYIKMLADEHIPSYYLGTKIKDSSDLGDLYEEAAKFFSAGSDTFDDPTSTASRVSPFGIVLTVAGVVTASAVSLLLEQV